MTTEHSSDRDVPEEIATTEEGYWLTTPQLEAIITGVLEQYDGLCMDEPEEREQLASALAAAFRTEQNDKYKDGDLETKAAT